MEQEMNYLKYQGKDGAYVVPLDELRAVSYATKNFMSGEYPGSAYFPIASGKFGYLKEAFITNWSGVYPVILKWADASTALSGNVISGSAYIFNLIISSGQANGGTYQIHFHPALGPYQSGICMVSGGAQLTGPATAVIETDPHTPQ